MVLVGLSAGTQHLDYRFAVRGFIYEFMVQTKFCIYQLLTSSYHEQS